MGREIMFAVDIAADPEAVYQAITTKDGLTSFWTPDVDAEPVVGSVARFGFEKAPVDLKMRVDELDRPRRIFWACEGDFPNWSGTRVEWRLAPNPEGPGTRLLFSHTGWPADQAEHEYASVSYTWGQIVGRLHDVLESGGRNPYLR